MAKKEFSQIEGFDLDWIDSLDWTDPAAAVRQMKDKAGEWGKTTNKRLQDLNAGMTKAQERAAEASEWVAFGNDKDNIPILRNWGNLRESVRNYGGIDAVLERLQAQQQAANSGKREVQEGVAAVQAAYQSGNLEWDQAQPLLAKLAAKERELDAVTEWYGKVKDQDYKRFEEALINVQRSASQQIGAILEPIVDGFDRLQPSERKLRPVLEAMVQKGFRTFDDGYNSLYGAEDTEARLRREIAEENTKVLAAKEEELRRQYEQKAPGAGAEGGGGDTNVGVWHRPVPKEGRRPDFTQSVLSKLAKIE